MDKENGLNNGSQNSQNLQSKNGFLKKKGYKPGKLEYRGTAESKPYPEHRSGDTSVVSKIIKPPRPDQYSPKDKDLLSKRKYTAKKTPKRKLDGVERNIRSSKFLIAIVGIIILVFSIVISYQNFLSYSNPDPSLEEKQYYLLNDILNHQPLQTEPESLNPTWDVHDYLTMTSEEFEAEFDTELNFIVEIEDISSYPVKYNRTLKNGLAWSNININSENFEPPGDVSTIHSLVNIRISSSEVHLAKVLLTVWV